MMIVSIEGMVIALNAEGLWMRIKNAKTVNIRLEESHGLQENLHHRQWRYGEASP
jgi:hypothetical protein